MEKINTVECFRRRYVIPCFQREYSWGEEEIEEFIKSLKNIEANEYCIGLVTVQAKNDDLLLIDGQQRITTLYLISIYCELLTDKKDILLKSEYEGLVTGNNNLVNILLKKYNKIPRNFIDGYRVIKKNIHEEEKELIRNKLKKVYYYEINIDANTDLNHYFEVMNSRGVQLSRSDLVKSYLMQKLSDEDRNRLNKLWYRYEKMDGKHYNYNSFKDINKKTKSEYKSINEILNDKTIKKDVKTEESNYNSEDDKSILNFEYFLLYIIRIYKNKDKEKDDHYYDISGEFNLDNLVTEYEDFFNRKQPEDVIKFLDFMIEIKHIYDNYIVKYDNVNESWSIGVKCKNDDMKFIQSCLRVSFVNRSLMHWIYKTLLYFYNNKSNSSDNINTYIKMMKDYIRDNYVNDFLKYASDVKYITGFNTPNIVLNYLDCLIKENYNELCNKLKYAKGLKPNEFKFKFRNSIEHFKPRHNEKGERNPEWVDDFGNLALLGYGTNTKLQNAEPNEKAERFEKDLSGYSLKLQIMSNYAKNDDWNEISVKEFRNIMIELLKKDLQNND